MPRFYCPFPLAGGQTVALPDEVARHAVGVLRLRAGAALTLFNGDGLEYAGVLEQRGKGAAVRLHAPSGPERESPLRVMLAQGISSGDRMDLTIQKSVELGVAAIQPVVMCRTIVKLAGEKLERRRAHWQGVVISACEQCGRNRVPSVEPIQDFTAWLRGREGMTKSAAMALLLDPDAEMGLRDLSPPTGPITLLAGPEGGFDPIERDAAQRAGFFGIRLGPRILRTETAALAALAAMQTLWGDFR